MSSQQNLISAKNLFTKIILTKLSLEQSNILTKWHFSKMSLKLNVTRPKVRAPEEGQLRFSGTSKAENFCS